MRSSGRFLATATGAFLALCGPAPANAFAGQFDYLYFDFTVDHERTPGSSEHLGEHALANQLPPHYPAPELKLPTTTVPLPWHSSWEFP